MTHNHFYLKKCPGLCFFTMASKKVVGGVWEVIAEDWR